MIKSRGVIKNEQHFCEDRKFLTDLPAQFILSIVITVFADAVGMAKDKTVLIIAHRMRTGHWDDENAFIKIPIEFFKNCVMMKKKPRGG